MSSQPKVSVIIPVYNTEKYLRECLDSVVNQTLRDIEIICVDDGSMDNSIHILEEFQRGDPRIKVVEKEHSGAGPTRNLGLHYAQGQFVTFLDSDDLFAPTALEKLYAHSMLHNADLTMCAGFTFSDDTKRARISNGVLNTAFLPDHEPFSARSHAKYLFQLTNGQPWGKIYNRQFLKNKHLLFADLPRTEDVPFTFPALALAKRISYIEEPLVLHRVLSGSGSLEDLKDNTPETPFKARVMASKILRDEGLFDLLRQSYMNNICNVVFYNLRGMKTSQGFISTYNYFKSFEIPYYGMTFDDSDYYYDNKVYTSLKAIADSDSCADFLFRTLKETIQSQQLQKIKAQTELKKARMELAAAGDELKRTREELKRSRKNEDALRRNLGDVQNSASFRIGRAITWLPRKIRGVIRSFGKR